MTRTSAISPTHEQREAEALNGVVAAMRREALALLLDQPRSKIAAALAGQADDLEAKARSLATREHVSTPCDPSGNNKVPFVDRTFTLHDDGKLHEER
jgi:hypothetical protein